METKKRAILVIDDSPDDIEILSNMLKSDYRVFVATDHEVTMKILRTEPPPDLILLDIMMPDIDGYRLCRELKAEEATKAIPVIFVTAKDAVEDEATGFDAGCVDYIIKPVNPLLVKARVKTHIDLKLAREDLKRQNDVLRENARLREDVEGIVRHDLKNPLMVILNLPGVLMNHENINENQKKYLKMIEAAGRKMLDMINRSIDLYKMERGTYQFNPVPVDGLHVLRQIVDGQRLTASEKNIDFEIRVDGKTPGEEELFRFNGEMLLFYTLCANLLKNAVEASPLGGKITVDLDAGDTVLVSIHNQGAIPEAIRDRFFQKFATSGKEHGTGLGAYSAKLITGLLGGTIDFETSEEKGTTLFVRLPRG